MGGLPLQTPDMDTLRKSCSRRSQMAEGLARALGEGKAEVTSAGLEASFVDPLAIEVMKEVGIDISKQISKGLSEFKAEDYDGVISLCGCGVNLPGEWVVRDIFEDWQLDDPEGEGMESFRRIRDELRDLVAKLLEQLAIALRARYANESATVRA